MLNEIIRICMCAIGAFGCGLIIMINQFLIIPAERRFFKWFKPNVFDPWWVKTRERIFYKTSTTIRAVARYATVMWLF